MSGADDHQTAADPPQAEGLSRRKLVAAAGVVGGGLGVGLAGTSTSAEAAGDTNAATGPRGSTVVEFRGRIDQAGSNGEAFTSYGYLTRVSHTRRSDLFESSPHNDSTALLTVFAQGDLKARVLDRSVHSLDIVGTMVVYQREHGGADFSDPSSFEVGTPVARFEVRLQDVLAVFATARGLPTLTGDMVQTRASALSGPLTGHRFGRRGSRLRMFATGLGELIDPVTLNAQLEIAGNWSVE
jgi:hypothetical protein